jgi:hypothetical protein
VPTSTRSRLRRLAAGIAIAPVVAIALVACEPATPEPIDSAHLIGRWELQTDGETEWFHLKQDGTFTAEIRSNAFLATTIPAESGTELRGSWLLDGTTLTFHIEGSDLPLVYELVSLTDRTLTTVSSDGTRHVLQKGL